MLGLAVGRVEAKQTRFQQGFSSSSKFSQNLCSLVNEALQTGGLEIYITKLQMYQLEGVEQVGKVCFGIKSLHHQISWLTMINRPVLIFF